MKKLRQGFAKGSVVGTLAGAQVNPRKVDGTGVLANDFKEIITGGLKKPGAQEDIVVDIVHANGQRPHGKGDAVALQLDTSGVADI